MSDVEQLINLKVKYHTPSPKPESCQTKHGFPFCFFNRHLSSLASELHAQTGASTLLLRSSPDLVAEVCQGPRKRGNAPGKASFGRAPSCFKDVVCAMKIVLLSNNEMDPRFWRGVCSAFLPEPSRLTYLPPPAAPV